ncbi:MAG TPA: hypothetical protein VNW71_22125 [Thermoanaerobaculia bacterium]|nr:hypothetical protein [Thermoanaerobaculia bacterium]
MLRATAIELRSEVRLGVQPRRVAGIAAREGRLVFVLSGAGNGATIAVIVAAGIAARGRIEGEDRERSSREEIVSQGSMGTSGRRSRRRIG